jgi:hypothetical protein
MVTNNSKKSVLRCFTLVLILLIIQSTLTSECDAGDYALLLQQSPVEGGSVEPGTGIHRIGSDSQITLRAVPQPGYQFVTWLGDVDEANVPVTTTYMDSPKIIIAVFERIQYDSIASADLLFSSPGGSGLRRSAADISSSSGGGAVLPSRRRSPRITQQINEPDDDELTGPGDPLMGPGEVPEPATLLLLTTAASFARFIRRRK